MTINSLGNILSYPFLNINLLNLPSLTTANFHGFTHRLVLLSEAWHLVILLLPWRHSTNHSSTIGAIRLIRAMIRYIILYYFKDSAMSYVHALVILFA